ncbi:MAG TPA: pitrilysin family protein [Candidatus Acidoferrales bacterium]|nr:pitrilysin family protein [Candidatus Acidoferrales bacterium]
MRALLNRLLLVLSILAFAAMSATLLRAQQPDIPFQKFTLSNGLTLIVHEDHKAPIVAVNLWYHVGSKNEKRGKTGFAHLFEHLMFGGSQHAPGSYSKALESVGATDLNGTTNFDRTNYFENVPTSALNYALWMEADRMAYLNLSQKTLDLQRGVVQNEKRQDENQPYDLTEEHFPENTFPAGHPYSWDVIGDMADLDAASFKDVQEWFHTYYGPSNVVIVLAGDIDAQTAKEKVEKYFGDIPPGPPVTHQQAWVAKMTGTHRETTEEKVPLPRMYQVWNVPPFASADSDYLDLVGACLGDGKTSRLYKRLVYDDQIASDVTVYNDSREIAGQFVIQVTAAPGHTLGEIEKATDQELSRFLRDGPTPAEVQRVQTQYLAAFLRGAQRIGGFGGKSDVLAQYAVFTGDPENYKVTLERIRKTTPADLRSAAARWLSDGVYIADVMPFPDYKPAVAHVDHTQKPALGAPPELKLPRLQRATLSNDLKVILAERPGAGLVNMWMATNAGSAADQFALPGTARLTSALLVDGTQTRTALQINDQTALLGAELSSYTGLNAGLDYSYVRLSALKSKLDPSLDLFTDVLLNPSFPPADFKREQKLQIDAIEQEKNQPVLMAARVLGALLYGSGHAYGNSLSGSGTTASVQKITRDDLIKFHRTWFRPNNSTLIVVGDTTLAELRPKLEKAFAAWKPGEVPKKNIATVPLPSKSVVYIVDKPNAGQSEILAADLAGPPDPATQIPIEAMNDAIGGTFGARLNMNLREDKHWSYGVHSFLLGTDAQRPFIVIAPVQTDKTKESIIEINKELRAFLSDRPVTSDELAHIQENETLRLPGSRETIDSVGNSIIDMVAFHWPDDYYNTMSGHIRALTTADLDAAAKEVIRPDNLVWVVVGDRAKIEAGIRQLNIGEVRFIDADGNPR